MNTVDALIRKVSKHRWVAFTLFLVAVVGGVLSTGSNLIANWGQVAEFLDRDKAHRQVLMTSLRLGEETGDLAVMLNAIRIAGSSIAAMDDAVRADRLTMESLATDLGITPAIDELLFEDMLHLGMCDTDAGSTVRKLVEQKHGNEPAYMFRLGC